MKVNLWNLLIVGVFDRWHFVIVLSMFQGQWSAYVYYAVTSFRYTFYISKFRNVLAQDLSRRTKYYYYSTLNWNCENAS